jgi:ketosteroid isomerase-like protein
MNSHIERIYREWQDKLSRNDADGLLSLYAPDATFESPLVPQLMGKERGVLRGHGKLGPFFRSLTARRPTARGFYRTGYLTNGRLLMWEYPRATPDGEQMDFAEVMEVVGGRIQSQRVYWGWLGMQVLHTGGDRR